MDKSVLLEKKKNLLNEEATSNELYLNNNFIDISKIIPPKTLIDFIFNDQLNQIHIFKGSVVQSITNDIELINSPQKFNDYCKQHSIENVWEEKLNDTNLSKYTKELEEYLKKDVFNTLDEAIKLGKKAVIENEDSSMWNLYLSYGFLYGISSYPNKDDKLLKAPLINIEVNVQLNDDGSILLSKWNEGNIIPNEVLFNFLNEQYDLKIDPNTFFNTPTDNDSSNATNNQFNVDEYFEKIKNIVIGSEIQNNFSKFLKTKKEQFIKEYNKQIFIKKMFTISLINPIGGKLLRDYTEILNQNYEFPVVDTIFSNNLNSLIYEKDNLLEINNPLNLSQKLAVANSLSKNLLIFGPPGTGKSEVIINVIANALLQHKTMLVVSEKKAALDVISERLGVLSKLIMSAFNEKTKNIFYENILDINKAILRSNPVNVEIKNECYQQIFDYYQQLNAIIQYTNVFGNRFNSFWDSFNKIDQIKFNTNKSTIENLYKFVKSNGSYKQKIADIYNLQKVVTKLNQIVGNSTPINIHIYDEKIVTEFLQLLNSNQIKNQEFSILHLLSNGEINLKKPLIWRLTKQQKSINFNDIIEVLRDIKTNKIYYIDGFNSFYDFMEKESNYLDYLIYHDWTQNTKALQVVEFIKNKNNINNIIHRYWESKLLQAKNSNQILFDFYTFDLRNKLLEHKELDKAWSEIVRVANLQKKPSINKIIKNYYDILRIIFPIWILSPDSAAITLPLELNEFDLGIFDESSQMRLERGIPLIYRCSNSVVSGDDKQLKPSNFFLKTSNLDETYEGHLDNVDSLLDKAKTSNWISFVLLNHYRSTNEELIYFSNKHFYDGKLKCISQNNFFDHAITTIEVNGVYNRQKSINEQEANKTVQILNENIENYRSFIIITFNQKQAEHIEVLARQNVKLSTLIDKNIIKIRSLENVQGDEGDMVIISTTFGHDEEGKFIQNFGPVNQNGGMNRINVMITRSKNKMYVLKSFSSQEITNTDNENTKILHDFFQYIEQLQQNVDVLKQESQINEIVSQNKENNLKQMVYDLNNEISYSYPNIEIKSGEYIGTNKIDILIRDKQTQEIKFLIIFESDEQINEYQTNKISLIEDIDKQKYFEDRKYRTLRLNNFEWTIDKKNIIQTICNCL